jgi:hypothetical protein
MDSWSLVNLAWGWIKEYAKYKRKSIHGHSIKSGNNLAYFRGPFLLLFLCGGVLCRLSYVSEYFEYCLVKSTKVRNIYNVDIYLFFYVHSVLYRDRRPSTTPWSACWAMGQNIETVYGEEKNILY